MPVYNTIITVIYAVLLITYFFVETDKARHRQRIIVKVTLALSYLIVALINVISAPSLVKWIIAVGMLFAVIGDILLVICDTHIWFKRGAYSFFVANILLIASQLYHLITNVPFVWWWCFAVGIAMYATLIICQKAGKLIVDSDVIKMNIYTASVTLNGSLGIALAVYGGTVFTLLWGIGSVLFMLADYFLINYKYGGNKAWSLITNSALYFSGLLLIALSLGL